MEGYTSVLHVILLALSSLIGISLPSASFLISFASVMGLVLFIFFLLLKKMSGRTSIIGVIVIAIYLIDGRLTIHVCQGLDTVLHMVMLACSFVISIYFIESHLVNYLHTS